MISLISSLLFVISANIDNIAIGISFGIKKINIPYKKNLFISLLMALITGIFMYSSKIINLFFSAKFLNLIGTLALILLGIFYIFKYIFNKNNNNEVDKNIDKNINLKEMIGLTIALSSNNIVVGIIASIAGVNAFYTVIFTFIISFLFLLIGNKIGKNVLNEFIQNYAEVLSAVILILLGILEFFIN